MKKNVFLNNYMSPLGRAIAQKFKDSGYYVYGADAKEDYEGICDRSIRFDIIQFVNDAEYRVRFTQIFDELMPRLNVLIHSSVLMDSSSLDLIDLGNWRSMLDADLTGNMLLSKLFLIKLKEEKGVVISIGHLSIANHSIACQTINSSLVGFINALSQSYDSEVKAFCITGRQMTEEKQNDSSIPKVADFIYYLSQEGANDILKGTNFVI